MWAFSGKKGEGLDGLILAFCGAFVLVFSQGSMYFYR
jgi:hypothetical protein